MRPSLPMKQCKDIVAIKELQERTHVCKTDIRVEGDVRYRRQDESCINLKDVCVLRSVSLPISAAHLNRSLALACHFPHSRAKQNF